MRVFGALFSIDDFFSLTDRVVEFVVTIAATRGTDCDRFIDVEDFVFVQTGAPVASGGRVCLISTQPLVIVDVDASLVVGRAITVVLTLEVPPEGSTFSTFDVGCPFLVAVMVLVTVQPDRSLRLRY